MDSARFFQERFNALFESQGWTQVNLAKEAKISQSQISAYKRGEYAPTLEILDRISKAMKVPPTYFLSDSPVTRQDSPTVPGLMKIIEDQEKRIQELEAGKPTPIEDALLKKVISAWPKLDHDARTTIVEDVDTLLDEMRRESIDPPAKPKKSNS